MEPLRRDAYAADEDEAHAPAEADALAEEDVPSLRGEGGPDKGQGFEEDPEVQDEASAADVDEVGRQGGDEERTGYAQAAGEGVRQGGGVGKYIVREVMGEKYTVTLNGTKLSLVVVFLLAG